MSIDIIAIHWHIHHMYIIIIYIKIIAKKLAMMSSLFDVLQQSVEGTNTVIFMQQTYNIISHTYGWVIILATSMKLFSMKGIYIIL